MSDIEAAIWSRIPGILKGTINLNTFKPKIKCYCLNDFCKSKYMNYLFSWLCFGTFKSFLFLLLFDCFWFYFWSFGFLFLASLWLKDYNKSKFMHLLCVIPPILFFLSKPISGQCSRSISPGHIRRYLPFKWKKVTNVWNEPINIFININIFFFGRFKLL